ncbi:DegT/DnrJ/EryC1/StrS aminotransferase [Candidatus Kaiserbacteria bacterium RIFCSPHIGHO2_02_FULL_49_11]|uniref:DegT/DnrJ/EryC1/StrS aminotransferase n=1 Tax=Candidatus Kaiserbacteria bacterium RIFCSPHIGHO2_02_FULL_49_11 TaxID=1798489 RepID=A0A1F6D1Z2_9BACT|nr:MAG: DegT/DnrJ/EryC1/StrS aminotransferase [Candidatus Kaiserbacteria bacterium RIFCSPHIGHO2_02_FULL_49_11]
MIKLTKYSFHNEAETKRALIDFIQNADVLSMGREVQKFEESFVQKQGRTYAVFVNSGSSANLVLFQALLNLGRLKKGARVGFSALTWSTNVMPIIQLGMVPVPIDCELDTLNVSSEILRRHIKDLDCFFITNALGLSSDIDRIEALCKEEGVVLLEDNCESLGSKIGGRLLGNFSLASTFSFFVGHHLSTIEGGMVCTDDAELYEALTVVRAHGWSRNLPQEAKKKLQATYGVDDFYSQYTFYDVGYNVRPTEINGCLGNIQLQYWDELVATREQNFNTLYGYMKTNKDMLPLRIDHMDVFSSFSIPIVCATEEAFEVYRKRFEDNDVEIRPIIAGNITKQPFYKKYVQDESALPNTDFIASHGFYFGNNADLTEEEIALLGSLLEPAVISVGTTEVVRQ